MNSFAYPIVDPWCAGSSYIFMNSIKLDVFHKVRTVFQRLLIIEKSLFKSSIWPFSFEYTDEVIP